MISKSRDSVRTTSHSWEAGTPAHNAQNVDATKATSATCQPVTANNKNNPKKSVPLNHSGARCTGVFNGW